MGDLRRSSCEWKQLPLTRFAVPGDIARVVFHTSACSTVEREIVDVPRPSWGKKSDGSPVTEACLRNDIFDLVPWQRVMVFDEVDHGPSVQHAGRIVSLVWCFKARQFGWVPSYCLDVEL